MQDTGAGAYLISKIKNHAEGSMYRMNASTADCYMFSIDSDGKDFQGGWDWIAYLVGDDSHLLNFRDGKFYEIDR